MQKRLWEERMGIFSPFSLPTVEQGFLGLKQSWYPQEHMEEEAASVSAGEALGFKGEDPSPGPGLAV